jgi:hypothetical protein
MSWGKQLPKGIAGAVHCIYIMSLFDFYGMGEDAITFLPFHQHEFWTFSTLKISKNYI